MRGHTVKRIALITGILFGVVGLYIVHHKLEADDGPTATSSEPTATTTPKQLRYEGPAISTTINGKRITLSQAAINLSSTVTNMLKSSDDSDSDDEEPVTIKPKPISKSFIFKVYQITPLVAQMLNKFGDLKKKFPKERNAQLIVKYLGNKDNPLPGKDMSNAEFIAMARTADLLNVKLLWQVAAASFAQMIHEDKKTMKDLEQLARTIRGGYNMTANPYSSFVAEVFRQYWLQYKNDEKLRKLLLKGFEKPEQRYLERISKKCFYKTNIFECIQDNLTPHAQATYPLLIPTFFTFGVSIQEMLDYGRSLNSHSLSNQHINNIEGLAKVEGLGSLEWLFLDGNQITTIPSKVEGLGSLEGLVLTGNQITTIPSKVEGLGSLEELYLNGNQITTIPSNKWGLPPGVVIYL